MAESAAAPEPVAAPPPPARGGLTTILLAANLVLLAAVLAAVLVLLKRAHAPDAPQASAARAEEKPSGPEVPEGAGPTLRLGDFVVRLKNADADRFARISFELEVPGEKEKEALTAHQAQIRDAFISVLSDRGSDDLRGSEGLQKAKQELLARAAALAKDAHLRQLYVTEFVVQ